jgi:HEAT repeat protein
MEHTMSKKIINKSIIGGLVKSLSSNISIERHRAREILVSIGKPVIGYLKNSAASRDLKERWEAIKVVAQIKDPSGIPILLAAMDDPEFEIRWIAAEGLIDLGEKCIKPLLIKLIDKNESVFFRNGAHHVLNELKMRGLYTDTAGLISLLKDIKAESFIPIAVRKELDRIRAS